MAALTAIHGIGPATARALAGVGISDVAALAAIDPDAPPPEAVAFVPRADWPAWVAAARALAAVPDGAPRDGEDTPPDETGPDAEAQAAPAPADEGPSGSEEGAAAPEAGADPAPAPGVAHVPAAGFGGLIPPEPAAAGGTGAPPPRPAIRVRGPARGFWRAGRWFGSDWVTVPLDEITAAQLAAIRDEARLVVEPAVAGPERPAV